MNAKDRLIALAERCEKAGISAAVDAPLSDLHAKRAFHLLSIADFLRSRATKDTDQ